MSIAAGHPRPLRERQRAERERLILCAAEEVIVEKGYQALAMEEIASRVGISRATIYLHFASKEDLVLALFERGLRAFLAVLDAHLSSAAAPREKLRAILEDVYGSMSGRHYQALSAVLQNPEFHARLAEKRRLFATLWEEPARRFAAVFEEGKAAGEFDPALPTSVMSSLFGALLTPLAYRRLIDQERMAPEEVVRHLSRFFFKGIAPGGPLGDADAATAPPASTPDSAANETADTADPDAGTRRVPWNGAERA
jgi:TetR/AcrR family transcriptional regulator, fatty acid metabolism regulator protein